MNISPLDIRKQTFHKTFRGVDEQEVSAFLELIADQLEEFIQENRNLKDRIATAEVQLENYRRIEEALRNALVTAEKVARDTKSNADQEVEILLKEAELRAQRSIQSARGILEGIRSDLVEMTKQRRDFLLRFRLLVETQLKMLDLKRVEYEGEEDYRRLEEIQQALFDEDPLPGEEKSGPPAGETEAKAILGMADRLEEAEEAEEAEEEDRPQPEDRYQPNVIHEEN